MKEWANHIIFQSITVVCVLGIAWMCVGDRIQFANTYIEGLKICEVKTQSQCTVLVISTENLKFIEEEK